MSWLRSIKNNSQVCTKASLTFILICVTWKQLWFSVDRITLAFLFPFSVRKPAGTNEALRGSTLHSFLSKQYRWPKKKRAQPFHSTETAILLKHTAVLKDITIHPSTLVIYLWSTRSKYPSLHQIKLRSYHLQWWALSACFLGQTSPLYSSHHMLADGAGWVYLIYMNSNK